MSVVLDTQAPKTFMESLKESMATSDLRRLQLGWAAASVGGWVFFIVLAVYAYDQGGAAAVGVAALARMAPAALAAPLAGLIIDRRSRRDVLLAIAIGRALTLTAIAAAVAAGTPLALVLALGAVFTVLQTAHKPAQAALLPALAHNPRQLAASNAIWTAVDSIGFLLGALAAGVLVAATSIETSFLITAGVFAASAWPFARLPKDPVPEYREHEEGEGRLEELASGFKTVTQDKSLRLLVGVLGATTAVEGMADVMVVLVALELLDLGGSGVGWLNSAWGFGGIVGGAAALSLLGHGRLATGLAGGCLLVGVPLMLIAAVPEVAVAVVALMVLGIGYSLIETAGLTLLQRLSSDENLGRVFSVVESSYWLTTGIGAMLAPAIVSLLGIRGALIAIGACLPLVVTIRWAALARFEAATEVPEEAFALLRRVPMFQPLPLSAVEDVSRRLTEIEVAQGEAVVRQGERGERCFVIAHGEFEVTCTEGAFPSLADGDIFGEIALLRDIPRTATVTARTDGLIYALDRETFQLVVGGHRFCCRTAQSMVDERMERVPVG